MRALLIVNPNATSTTPTGRDLLAHALSSRLQLKVAHTTHRGHAGELARQAALDGASLVIAHGGDGTVNEVVNGLLGPPHPPTMHQMPIGPVPTVAVVPGGSANVFARSLGIAADPLAATNQLLDLLAARRRRRIGLGHCDNRWFTFNAGMGLDAMVVETIEAARRAGHTASASRYVRTAIRTFFRESGDDPALTVTLPDREPVSGVHYAFVSNASPWTYMNARAVHTNPETGYDTGLGVFAMRTMRVLPSLRLARQLLATGAQPKLKPLLRDDDVPRVSIHSERPIGLQLDGDYIGVRSEVDFTAVPDALDVVAPPM